MTDDGDEQSHTVDQRITEEAGRLRELLSDNSRIIILGGGVLAVLQLLGVVSLGLPGWWPLAATVVLAAGAAAHVGAEKIAALLPDEQGILLVSLRGDRDGGAIYELAEDTFDEMTVYGDLYRWPETSRTVYEVRSYYPDQNVAIGNWRESMPASAFLAEQDVEDAMAAIGELRDELEPIAAEAKFLRRRFRGIARRIDQERTKERFREIDTETVDRDVETTIAEIIDEELPATRHPRAGRGDSEPEAMTQPERPAETNGRASTNDQAAAATDSAETTDTELGLDE